MSHGPSIVRFVVPARPSKLLALVTLVTLLTLAACGNKPKAPEWQMNARGALERYQQAFLTGDNRVAAAEFARARTELAATGLSGLVARAELTRCALLATGLAFDPCAGFEAFRADAPAAERAYADYLAGRLDPRQAALLPVQYRAVAGQVSAAAGATSVAGTVTAAAVKAIEDPLSRLIASAVLFQAGNANPQVIQSAVDTASAQGWRRPLLAWLGVQAQRAEQAGAADEAERVRRRMALVQGDR